MPETAETGKSKLPRQLAARLGAGKHAPKRFDPVEHGGVKQHGRLFLVFGVYLPLFAMLFETNIHFCARHFFDPFPSPGHVVLFGLIPFSNFLAWLGTRRDLSNHYAFMSLVSGMAVGVGCLYTLMFLPLTPMACLFSLVLGFGLLGLAPLLSLPCSWQSGKTVCQLAKRKITYFNAHQMEHIGHMIILCMVVAIELPSTLTRINLSRAATPDPSVAKDGVVWLRKFGSQEVLLRACYERSGRATDILGSLYETAHPVSVDEARRVFYQVSGKPFNSVPIPRSARATIQHTGAAADPNSPNANVEDEFDLDTDIAGEAVSGVARGLSVKESKISTKIDADSALASIDWSFDFANDSKFDREARAKVLLPPQAVVTRASLTVNGVERDATIMVRNVARARYRQAVTEHKDPLLVSTCGTDQLLVQCFPVRPGESMKVRLQIAAPLVLNNTSNGILMMPAFLERNFQVDLPNAIDVVADKALAVTGLVKGGQPEIPKDIKHVTGQINANSMAEFDCLAEVQRDKNCRSVWCKTDQIAGGAEIRRVLSSPHFEGVKKLIVVIDGSASMQRFLPQIADGLKSLPPELPADIKIVGDTVEDLTSGWQSNGATPFKMAVDALEKFQTAGGEDDSTALGDVLAQAAKEGGTAVLWVHGAQPLKSSSQRPWYETNPSNKGPGSVLFDMQVLASPNEVLNSLSSHLNPVRVPRYGSVKDDLSALFQSFKSVPQNAAAVNGATLVNGAVLVNAPPVSSGPIILAPQNSSLPVSAPGAPPTLTNPAPAAILNQAFLPQTALTVQASGPPPYRQNLPVRLGDYEVRQGSADQLAVHSGRQVDSRLAKIWANQQIIIDEKGPRRAQRREASELAEAFQIVSSVSSAVVTTPEPQAGYLAHKQSGADKDLHKAARLEFFAQDVVSETIARSKQAVIDNLGTLSGSTLKKKEFAVVVPEERGVLNRKVDRMYEPPLRLHGATNGTIGSPGAFDGAAGGTDAFNGANGAPVQNKIAMAEPMPASPSRANHFMRFPVAYEAYKMEQTAGTIRSDASNEEGQLAPGLEADEAPPAKIVPEADTWLLLLVIGAVLAGGWLVKRRRMGKA